jgi:transposase
VARELGIEPNMLSRWSREAQQQGQQAFGGPCKPRDEEMANLNRELSPVRNELAFDAKGDVLGQCLCRREQSTTLLN